MSFYHLHLHTMYSNGKMLDSPNSVEEYCETAKKIGLDGFAITEHGNLTNWSHKKKVMEENGFKYIHACEVYVSNSLKTKSYHCVLVALNEKGVEELNVLTSNSFEKGNGFICDEKHFYRVPRVFVDEILETENLAMLTACLGGFPNRMFKGEDDAIEVAEKILPWGVKTGKLYLEIQPQNNEEQIEYNQNIVDLARDFGLPLIATNDVHYTEAKNKIDRDVMQLSTNIVFDNGDEGSLDLHMKSEEEMRNTFIGIPEEAVNEAIANTVKLAESIDEFEMDYSPKYPKIYGNEEEEFLKRVENVLHEDEISNEEFERLASETEIYKKLGQMSYIMMTSDWLQWMRDQGIDTGDGRGCFTKDALIHTLEGLKTLNNISVGDFVLSEDGNWNIVDKTFKYDIVEDMVEFRYDTQGNNKYKNICTKDHKVLTIDGWKEAKDIVVGDMLCSAKIGNSNNHKPKKIVFDLSKYTNFEYDEEFIYESYALNKPYKYSPRDLLENNVIPNRTIAKRIINGHRNFKDDVGKRIIEFTGFNTLDEYSKYCKDKSHSHKVVPRYLELDYETNVFIGLMYGDGFTCRSEFGLAINNSTKKDLINRGVFNRIAKKFNSNVRENVRENLSQLICNSKVLLAFIKDEMFTSKKNEEKVFNVSLLNQTHKHIEGIRYGLDLSDGCFEKTRVSFDNTSKSIIGVYKTITSMLGECPMTLTVREAHENYDGSNCKESYKLRRYFNGKIRRSSSKYTYLKVTEIIRHKNISTTVYDMEVRNNHSYTINNIVVHNSCTGSQVAYRFGATGIDSMKWETNLFRFLNPDRVSMADIDVDISSEKRELAKSWFYDHPRMNACEVGAFGTYQEKEAINCVVRGFNNAIKNGKLDGIAFEIDKSLAEDIKNKTMKYRKLDEYARFFSMVDRLIDKVNSFKNHPAGVVVWHGDLKKKIGFYATSNEKLDGRPISNFNMNELDALNYIKMDALGLSTMEVVNTACDIAGIDRLNSDNVDYEDEKVWDNIINNGGAGIFQFSGVNTYRALNKALTTYKDTDISNLFVMCHCSGIIRPSCASIRDDFLNGNAPRWNFEEITNFFPKTFGYIIYQEDIMNFLTKFCGYSGSESDSVRRKIAKKKKQGYEEMMEEIKSRFRKTMYLLAEEKFGNYDDRINNVEEMIEDDLEYFIQVVEDAQNYA